MAETVSVEACCWRTRESVVRVVSPWGRRDERGGGGGLLVRGDVIGRWRERAAAAEWMSQMMRLGSPRALSKPEAR